MAMIFLISYFGISCFNEKQMFCAIREESHFGLSEHFAWYIYKMRTFLFIFALFIFWVFFSVISYKHVKPIHENCMIYDVQFTNDSYPL
jgi:hypothetical protein